MRRKGTTSTGDPRRMRVVNGEPPRRWSARLSDDLSAVRVARLVVRRWLGRGDRELLRDAESVATELVSNAVRYGASPIKMSLSTDEGTYRLEVFDAGTRSWARRWPDDGGWGFLIVSRLAWRWGFDEARSCVWCELRPRRRSHE